MAKPAMNRLRVSPAMSGVVRSAVVMGTRAGSAMSIESGGRAASMPRKMEKMPLAGRSFIGREFR